MSSHIVAQDGSLPTMILKASDVVNSPPMPTTVIREASTQDVPAIKALGTYVYTLTFGHSVEQHQLQAYLDEAYSTSSITCDVNSALKTVLVASIPKDASQPASHPEQERIVGFAILTRGSHAEEPCLAHLEKIVELQRLYVHPDFHGKGVARSLSDELESIAKSEGFETMWLGVWEENLRAQRLYEKMKYTKVGEHDFDFGGVIQTDWILLKSLV